MAENINIQRRRGGMSLFSKIPWTFLIIAYVIVVHNAGLAMTGVLGYAFIGLGVFVLFAEFFKSGDINTAVFLLDIIFAVTAVVIATGLLTYLVWKLGETPNFYHWFGFAIILGDAILSPFNSFRTALRNFGLGG